MDFKTYYTAKMNDRPLIKTEFKEMSQQLEKLEIDEPAIKNIKALKEYLKTITYADWLVLKKIVDRSYRRKVAKLGDLILLDDFDLVNL